MMKKVKKLVRGDTALQDYNFRAIGMPRGRGMMSRYRTRIRQLHKIQPLPPLLALLTQKVSAPRAGLGAVLQTLLSLTNHCDDRACQNWQVLVIPCNRWPTTIDKLYNRSEGGDGRRGSPECPGVKNLGKCRDAPLNIRR
jgi:hypothetical protein